MDAFSGSGSVVTTTPTLIINIEIHSGHPGNTYFQESIHRTRSLFSQSYLNAIELIEIDSTWPASYPSGRSSTLPFPFWDVLLLSFS